MASPEVVAREACLANLLRVVLRARAKGALWCWLAFRAFVVLAYTRPMVKFRLRLTLRWRGRADAAASCFANAFSVRPSASRWALQGHVA